MKPLNPTVRHEIINEVDQLVFGPELDRFFREKEKLISENHLLGGGKLCLTVNGRIIQINTKAGRYERFKPIHPSLHDAGLTLLALMDRLDRARKTVVNSMAPLLARCESAQDVRDAFPNLVSIKLATLQIGGLDRTREQGYIFSSDPDKMRTFEAMLEVLFYYMANRLVY